MRDYRRVMAHFLMQHPIDRAMALDAGEAGSGERRTPLRREHERRFRLLLALEPPQRAQFVTEDRMRAGRAFLDPADVQGRGSQVDLIRERRSTSSAARKPC
ncbi:MAG: hypothetical protein WB677_09000, partial [Xanthobacteraceae bacterium]